MVAFIYENQTILIIVAFFVLLFILYLLAKSLPTKVQKKDVKKEAKPEPKKEAKPETRVDTKEESKPAEESKTEEDKKSKKPQITQVYKRETSATPAETETSQKAESDQYDRKVEFVKTSSNVSKFKTFVNEDEKLKTDEIQDSEIQEENIQENLVAPPEIHRPKYFDRSRRLSKIIENNDFDNMFSSHISDKYTNLNIERHLNLDESFEEKLFKRATSTLDNSESKFSGGDNSAYQRDWERRPVENFENQNNKIADNIKLDAKTILTVDSIMNRKGKK